MKLAILLTLIGTFQITSYRSIKEQTDNSPFNTSTGERVSPDGIAVSQDLLCPRCLKLMARCNQIDTKKLHYGQWVYIKHVGLKRINDVMNKRHKNRMDVWVATLEQEKEFHKLYKNVKLEVYRVEDK